MARIRLFTSKGAQGKRRGRVKKNPELATSQRVSTPRVPGLGAVIPVRLHVEQLPEGVYVATSDDIPGLVAQGRTVAETLDIAEDVARRLLEARRERSPGLALRAAEPGKCTIIVRM